MSEFKLPLQVDQDITDISFVKYFTKLKKLTLGLNDISKGLESLENLPLKELRIEFNNVINLSVIGKIKTLENLSIWGGKKTESLNNLRELKKLSLASVDINSLCKLKDLTSLEYLDLRWNKNLTTLNCIEQFTNLKKLHIKGSPITDLSPLIKANSIEEFNFNEMPVEDISPLAKMKNLKSILFSRTKIKYLSPLKESKSLKSAQDISERLFEEYFNRSLARCSAKSMTEVREGKTCFEKDGTLKVFWKRWLGL